jgi:hypothetical protein
MPAGSSQTTGQTTLLDLPLTTWPAICSHLPTAQALKLALTCKALNHSFQHLPELLAALAAKLVPGWQLAPQVRTSVTACLHTHTACLHTHTARQRCTHTNNLPTIHICHIDALPRSCTRQLLLGLLATLVCVRQPPSNVPGSPPVPSSGQQRCHTCTAHLQAIHLTVTLTPPTDQPRAPAGSAVPQAPAGASLPQTAHHGPQPGLTQAGACTGQEAGAAAAGAGARCCCRDPEQIAAGAAAAGL